MSYTVKSGGTNLNAFSMLFDDLPIWMTALNNSEVDVQDEMELTLSSFKAKVN